MLRSIRNRCRNHHVDSRRHRVLLNEQRLSIQVFPSYSSTQCDRSVRSIGQSTHQHVRENSLYDFVRPQRRMTSGQIGLGRPEEDTIYALSTANGRAAIAIIRISGSLCLEIYSKLCPEAPPPKANRASVRTLYDPSREPNTDNVLDKNAIVLYFRAPRSSTGEDVLELHVHGGIAIISAVLQAIGDYQPSRGRLRHAGPGEFTRRAFHNDCLDLTQVEALGDALAAMTEQQRKLSLLGNSDQLTQRYEVWRSHLLQARGELEALIDFSEDQHFEESPGTLISSTLTQVQILRDQIKVYVQIALRGELLRNGIRVALFGAPNVGKSSLLNCLIGRDAAIVSHEAGTTRDVVEISLDLGGYLCRIADTAGLRKQNDERSCTQTLGPIEAQGIQRAKEWASNADIIVLVLELVQDCSGSVSLAINSEIIAEARKLANIGKRILVAINKVDLLAKDLMKNEPRILQPVMESLPSLSTENPVFLSCLDASHNGIEQVRAALVAICQDLTFSPASSDDRVSQFALGASERHRLWLENCLLHLDVFVNEVSQFASQDQVDIVLAAEALRGAATALANITGRAEDNDVEEVLGVIFEKFCVGK